MAKSTSSNGSQTVFIILGVVIFVALIGMLFSFTPMPCTRLTKRDLDVWADYNGGRAGAECATVVDFIKRWSDVGEIAKLNESYYKAYMPEPFYAYNTGTDSANLIPYIFTDKFINYLYKFTFQSNIKKLYKESTGCTNTLTSKDYKTIANSINTALNELIADQSNLYQKYLDERAEQRNAR